MDWDWDDNTPCLAWGRQTSVIHTGGSSSGFSVIPIQTTAAPCVWNILFWPQRDRTGRRHDSSLWRSGGETKPAHQRNSQTGEQDPWPLLGPEPPRERLVNTGSSTISSQPLILMAGLQRNGTTWLEWGFLLGFSHGCIWWRQSSSSKYRTTVRWSCACGGKKWPTFLTTSGSEKLTVLSYAFPPSGARGGR